MNVALTRCRKGMVVVTDKGFLQGKGKKTLSGSSAAPVKTPRRVERLECVLTTQSRSWTPVPLSRSNGRAAYTR